MLSSLSIKGIRFGTVDLGALTPASHHNFHMSLVENKFTQTFCKFALYFPALYCGRHKGKATWRDKYVL